jgi:hypothetical protein
MLVCGGPNVVQWPSHHRCIASWHFGRVVATRGMTLCIVSEVALMGPDGMLPSGCPGVVCAT